MKKQLRILTAILLIFVTTFGMSIEASAAGKVIDTNVVRRADLPNIFTSISSPSNSSSPKKCEGVQAMAVSRSSKNCLYSLKIKNNSEAVLYYFPNISNWNKKAAFSIYDVGHANGMTVDTHHIYICASPNGNEKNRIIRIRRDYIEDRANQIATEEKIDVATEVLSNSLGDYYYKIMEPEIVDSVSNGVTTYEPYDIRFSTITRAESTGKFIIGTEIAGVDKYQYNGFVRAEIIGDRFVISSDPDDTFLVENNIVHKYASRQDIYYLQGYGLFIGRWYGGYKEGDENNQYINKTKNVILWADIDGETDTTHKGYRCYIPDKIKVDVTNLKEGSTTIYEKFEIESMGITANRNLIATFNVIYTKTYYDKFISGKNENITSKADADGIYKITRSDGKTFKLTDKV